MDRRTDKQTGRQTGSLLITQETIANHGNKAEEMLKLRRELM